MSLTRATNPRWLMAAAAGITLFLLVLALPSFRRSPAALTNHFPSSKHSDSQVHNETLGFQKIFALNLPERTDHRDALILQTAVTGISFEFIDGVHPDSIKDKVLPYPHNTDLSKGVFGSWRAHLNAIGQVVQRGLTTALILEDDVDWDIQLKDILDDVAAMSRIALSSNPGSTLEYRGSAPSTTPNESPYGSGWDVLWLGHCGMTIPDHETTVIHSNDISVPQPQYLKSWDINAITPMIQWPNHTRLITRPQDGTCSLAYAVSQHGARKILYQLGLQRLDTAYDLMLRTFCAEPGNTCLGVLPQLFEHHRRKGPPTSDSDISISIDPDREKAVTKNIRWSVRLNLDRLISGRTDFEDQYPDT